MALDDLAARLTAAGAELAAAAAALPDADPGGAAFGADATGCLGDLGRELHRMYSAALDARIRESAAHQARLADTADAVTRAAAAYADAEAAAAQRFEAGR